VDAVGDDTHNDHVSMTKAFEAASRYPRIREMFTGDPSAYRYVMGVVAITGRDFSTEFAR
jgi:hypothetical protein